MNIELKHLAPYLPYGLKVKILPISNLYEEQITDIDCMSNEFVTFKKAPDFYWVDEEPDIEFKPILQPLSDLVNLIEFNGRQFVPLIELLQIHLTDSKWGLTSKFDVVKWFADETQKGVMNGKYYTIRYSYELSDSTVSVTDLTYDTAFNRFTLREKQPREKQLWLNYKPLEEKLIEWNFDVFGLIDSGLAINKNNVPQIQKHK